MSLDKETGYHLCDICKYCIANSLLEWDKGSIELCSYHVPIWWAENKDKESTIKATYIELPALARQSGDLPYSGND